MDAKIGSDFWLGPFFSGGHRKSGSAWGKWKRAASKDFQHLESIENMGPSTALIGKNL